MNYGKEKTQEGLSKQKRGLFARFWPIKRGALFDMAIKTWDVIVKYYGNLDSLESVVNKFYDKSLTFKSSIECRNFALYNYSKEQMFTSYLNLYQKINDKG